MNETEKEAWQAFREVVDGFLGNKKKNTLQRVRGTAYQKLPKHRLSHVSKASLFMVSSGILLGKSW